MRLSILVMWAVLSGVLGTWQAQDGLGAICPSAFEDSNTNGVQDAGEFPLAGISTNLATDTNLILQTHITTADPTPFCFENLPPATYVLVFDASPNHIPRTQNSISITLQAQQRLTISYGATPQDPLPRASAETQVSNGQLSTLNRVLLALLAAIVSMIFCLGFGVVIRSLL